MIMKKRLILLTTFTLLLTGCDIPFISPSSEDESMSNLPSGEISSNESSGNNSSEKEEASEKPSDSSELPSASSSSEEELPSSKYSKNDNGFVYPSNARYQVDEAYYEFWNPDTKINFEIKADAQIWQWMDQYGHGDSVKTHDLYWPVNVKITVNGKVHEFDEVGMRRKGNTSRGYSFMDGNRVSDAISFKLSFKEVFTNEEYKTIAPSVYKSWTKDDPAYVIRDERQFLPNEDGDGMKTLDFKMYKTGDRSMVNQPFIFSTFQKMGVITGNSTLASVDVYSGSNHSNMGVLTINEPINKHLLRRYFDKKASKGDLYKVGWGQGNKGNLRIEEYNDNKTMIGVEDKSNYYQPRYDAKESDGTHKNLINLMQVLKDNENKSPAQYISALQNVVDIDSFLMYAAVSYLTGNEDDMRNNGNNYYIYFNPSENNKAYFIPYDYDWALGLGWDGNGGLAMADLSPFYAELRGNGNNIQDNRLWMYTIINNQDGMYKIQTNTEWQNIYYNKIVSIINDGYYSKATFIDLYNRYRANYKNETNALKKHNNEISNGFESTSIFDEYYKRIVTSVKNNKPTK